MLVNAKYTDRGSITEISLCMPGLHRIKIMDTRQVREYLDSTVDRIKMADDHDVK